MQMPKYVLALDQGTTSSRAILFDRQGRVASVSQQEFPQIFPRAGWVEHNPEDIWSSQLYCAREALSKAGARAEDVAAIGITNQRETTVVWDRASGQPVHNAIVWQCRRTALMCDKLKGEKFDRVIRKKTGLVTDAYFSGTKVAWLLENVKDARKRANAGDLAFGTVDTWLINRLSGGKAHVTDVSNASRTLMYDIRRQKWDDEILKKLRVPGALLPAVKSSSEVYTETDPDLFGAPIRIAGDAGDQQAALFRSEETARAGRVVARREILVRSLHRNRPGPLRRSHSDRRRRGRPTGRALQIGRDCACRARCCPP